MPVEPGLSPLSKKCRESKSPPPLPFLAKFPGGHCGVLHEERSPGQPPKPSTPSAPGRCLLSLVPLRLSVKTAHGTAQQRQCASGDTPGKGSTKREPV
ncbi:hypothetical protein MRX96_005355 [Rhipicephalus microplus]